MIRDILGVDVASQELVCYQEESLWKTVGNNKASISAFLKELPKETIIALEATGGYGHLLAEFHIREGMLFTCCSRLG